MSTLMTLQCLSCNSQHFSTFQFSLSVFPQGALVSPILLSAAVWYKSRPELVNRSPSTLKQLFQQQLKQQLQQTSQLEAIMKVSIFFAAFLFLAVICASFTYAGGKGKGKGDGGKGKGGGGDGGGKGKGKGHLIHDTLDVDQRKSFISI